MIYQRGKEMMMYYNTGFKNFGCLMGMVVFLILVLWKICRNMLKLIIRLKERVIG